MELILHRKITLLTIIILFCWVLKVTPEEDRVKKKYRSNIGSENTRTSISLLKNNPKRIGLLKRMIRESGWTLQTVINLKTKNEELIQLLKQEIETL